MSTYQVADEAEVGYGDDGCQHIEPHAGKAGHVHDHKVHVDGTHHQDDASPSDLPCPEDTEQVRDNVSVLILTRSQGPSQSWPKSYTKKDLGGNDCNENKYIRIHLQSIHKVIHYGFETGEGQYWDQRKR